VSFLRKTKSVLENTLGKLRGTKGVKIKYITFKNWIMHFSAHPAYMGQTRQEVKRPKKWLFFSTSAWSPDMILLILRLKMVSTQQIRQRHQFKTFVRSVDLGKLG
jgi:hypothetical protein